jgi:hypothetical protein
VLTQHERAGLQNLLIELLEAEEPMAMRAVLLRIAQRMAFRAAGKSEREKARKWQELVDALSL